MHPHLNKILSEIRAARSSQERDERGTDCILDAGREDEQSVPGPPALPDKSLSDKPLALDAQLHSRIESGGCGWLRLNSDRQPAS